MHAQLRGLKYERMKLRHALFSVDAKYKKDKRYKEPESDLDDDAIATHEDNLKAKEIEKAEKKFQKDNEKAAAEGKEQQDESVLKEKIKEIEAEVGVHCCLRVSYNFANGLYHRWPELKKTRPRHFILAN